MTVGLGKCKFDAIFIYSLLEVGMPSSECGGHINFEVSWNLYLIAEAM
jgi:hypothetical protein